MSDTEQRKIELSSGITMNVALLGPKDAPPAIFLHGFPESHRTWLPVAARLKDRVRCILPDLRGFGDSDRPLDVSEYAIDKIAADIFALADALGHETFALVGHDWGGAASWALALRGSERITRLGIVNSPHPLLFQKSLIEDEAQRAASQYMNAFKNPDLEKQIEAMGFDNFFDKSFARHVDLAKIAADERDRFIANWSRPGALTAMFNWYRTPGMTIPPIGEEAALPDWVKAGLPKIPIPVRVVWGLEDKALLAVQLDGMDEVADDIEITRLPGVGHFATWEAPDEVSEALGDFLAIG